MNGEARNAESPDQPILGVRVRLCGGLELEWDGERLEGQLPGRQGRLLFSYLTLHRERPVRRDELVEALWSEEGPPPSGDALLRPPLSRLRRALGDGRLEGRGELALRFPEGTRVDYESVEDGLRFARASLAEEAETSWERARQALAIADQGLLPGFEVSWLEPFRAQLEEWRIELLEAVAMAGAALGEAEAHEAEAAARRAVEASPFRESSRLALLRVLRRRGNTAEALVAFEDFRALLADRLGSIPGAELRALHEELLSAEPAARPAAIGADAPNEPAALSQAEERLPERLELARAAPWVGRHAALERLREEASTERSGLTLIAGEGGIGKTRLVAELAAGLTEFDVLYGRCDEEETFPYGPWVEMLRARLAALDSAELAALAGPEAGDLARLLPELGERLPNLVGPPLDAGPETERRLLFLAVGRLLGRLATERPLLVVVDDLHWADRSSLLLARHLGRQLELGPVLLVGTYRDTELGDAHPLPELIADVERYRPVARLRLEGMDEGEVGELIDSWRETDAETEAVSAIRAETEGNPFFVKQLVRHLEETDEGGGLDLGVGRGVPEGVRDVITRRVALLPEEAAPALRTAALIGRDFDYELLQRVVELPGERLLDILDAAVRGALLVEVPAAPGRYTFAHALLRSTLETELSATRRALTHRRIGEEIERLHRDRLDPWFGELARHFDAAVPQETERAVDYSVRAAGQASERLAYDEAAVLLARAVALRRGEDPVDGAELARIEIELARAEAAAGRWVAARASFGRAAEAAREAEAGGSFARAALGYSGETWEQFGRDDSASVALLEEALERLPGDDSRLRSQLLARLAVVLYLSSVGAEGRIAEAAAEAVAIARRIDEPEALIAALVASQTASWQPGSARERLDTAAELIELAEASGALAEAAEAHLWRGGALLELCRLDEAEVHFERQGELAERGRRFQPLAFRDANRIGRLLLEGEFDLAEERAGELLAKGQGGGEMPLLLQFYGVHTMAIFAERDRLAELLPNFEQMAHEMKGLPGWAAPLAWAEVQAARPELARERLERISDGEFAGLPRDINFVPTLAIAAQATWQLGDAKLAARVEPLLAPFSEEWVVFGVGSSTLGPVAYALALTQLLQERPGDAVASFELALERSLRMDAAPYVARSRAGLAEALRGRGEPGDRERAEEAAASAAAEARRIGMPRLLRELGLDS